MSGIGQSWMIIFLLAAGHGLFLSSFLILRSPRDRGARYLSLLMFLFASSLLYYVAYWTKLTSEISPFWGLVLTFPTLFGPLVHGYFRNLNGLKTRMWLHGLPFLVHLLYVCGYYIYLLNGLSITVFNKTGLLSFTILQNVSLMVYSYLLVRNTNSLPSDSRCSLKHLSWAFTCFSVSFVTYYVLVYTIDFKPVYDYVISFFMSAFMYLVGYLSYGNPLKRQGNSKHKPYRNSGLTPELAKVYKDQLLMVMEQQRPYLQGDIKLLDLATAMEMSAHHLSEVINSQFNVNFSEFLNQYRVEEARRLLVNNQRISDAGFLAGFNNKTSFSQTFKKHTGLTPSQYRAKYHSTLKTHSA